MTDDYILCPQDLNGKTVVVTGAGSRGEGIGNGRAIALALDRAGAHLVLLDSDAAALRGTAETLSMPEDSRICAVVDVTDEEAVRAVVENCVDYFSSIDGLVNNVGISGPPGTVTEVDSDSWASAMKVNVESTMVCSKYVIPAMGTQGSIVNLGSVAGMVGGHHSILYPTSKGAVINMTRAMAAHHGRSGIRVNCVSPGLVYTPMVSSRGMSESMRKARKSRSLLGTEGTAWDVANAAMFLLSSAAKWITGVNLPVDAGATAGDGCLPVPNNDSN